MRKPTIDEMKQVLDCLGGPTYDEDTESAESLLEYSVVYDNYITDGPGYAGKVLMAVFPGSPSYNEVFIWNNDVCEKVEKED